MNSRQHARLRRLQITRKCAKVADALLSYIYEKNQPMIEAAIEDMALHGSMGRWELSDDGLLSYERATFS